MPERNGTMLPVKLLSGVLALVIWAFVTGERPVERRVSVPVRFLNIPAELTSAGGPPFTDVVVSGPRLPLALLNPGSLSLDLDLAGKGAGMTVFTDLERRLVMPAGFRVVRLSPARIEVLLKKRE